MAGTSGTSAYVRFRSTWFLGILAILIPGWIAWNSLPGLPHFDGAGFPLLNLLLSIEASLSVALVLLEGQKADALARAANTAQEARHMDQLRYMAHLMEGMVEMLKTKPPSPPL